MSGYGNPYPQHGQGQGEAASYYNDQQQQQQYPPPQYQQHQQQQYPPQQYPPQQGQYPQQYDQRFPTSADQPGFGPDGERGVLGAIGGGLAGGVGGHAIGGKNNHSKLGTVLGVVGGAFAGHKLQDGISDWKDKRDDEKKHSPHSSKNSSQECLPLQAHGVRYLGNFSGSCRDMRLEGCRDYHLHASCRRMDGSFQGSSIDLNRYLENDQGCLRWVSPGEKKHNVEVVQAPRQVTVQCGDTLRGIARQVGVGFEEIARVNGIQNPDLIYPGQVLNIPGGGSCAPPPCGGGGGAGNFGHSARNVRLVDGGRRLEAELLRNGEWVGSSIVLDERIGNENGTLCYKS